VRPTFTCVRYGAALTAKGCAASWRRENIERARPRAHDRWTRDRAAHCVGCPLGERHDREHRRGRPLPIASLEAEAFRAHVRSERGELDRVLVVVERAVDADLAGRSERRRGHAQRQARAAVLRRVGGRRLPDVGRELGTPDASAHVVSLWIDRGRRLVARVLGAFDGDPAIAAVVELMGASSTPPRGQTT
jgi:hypothetical protein